MKAAIIGLQASGTSALVSAISGRPAVMTGCPDIHEVIVPVPDQRLEWLAGLYKPQKTVWATIDCLDVPGLSFLDEHGRAAARRLLGQIRTADMMVIVARAFEDSSVAAYRNRLSPEKDLDELKTELLLADLELVSTRIERLEKQANKPVKTQPKDKAELVLQLKLQAAIEAEQPIRSAIHSDEEMEMIKSLGLLTLKPMMAVVNIGENQLNAAVAFGNAANGLEVVGLCAKIESELAQLDLASRRDFMKDLGIEESAAAKFVHSCYKTLGLISFLTVGKDEVRAWPIKAGTTALDAAGKVHSDIKRGFIRAETMAYTDLKQLGDEKAVRAAGKMRLEGKQYIVQDGDIINFRFNV